MAEGAPVNVISAALGHSSVATTGTYVWLRGESLEDSANLPEPQTLAEEIAADFRANFEQIENTLADLRDRPARAAAGGDSD